MMFNKTECFVVTFTILCCFVVISSSASLEFSKQGDIQECCFPEKWCANFSLKRTLSRLSEVHMTSVLLCVDVSRNISIQECGHKIDGRMGQWKVIRVKKNSLSKGMSCLKLAERDDILQPFIGIPRCLKGVYDNTRRHTNFKWETSVNYTTGRNNNQVHYRIGLEADVHHLISSIRGMTRHACTVREFTSHEEVTHSSSSRKGKYTVVNEYKQQPESLVLGEEVVNQLNNFQLSSCTDENSVRL
jgi:hypothetical protein